MRRYARYLSWVCVLLAALGFVLPWHLVIDADWGGALCWAPDCRSQRASTSELHYGYSEDVAFRLGLGVLLPAAIAVLNEKRLTPFKDVARTVVAVLLSGVSTFVLVLAVTLDHLLSRTETRSGQPVFVYSNAVFFLTCVTQLVFAVRRALRRGAGESSG